MKRNIKSACLDKLVNFSMNLAKNTVQAAIEKEGHAATKTQPKWMTLYEIPVPQHLKDQYKK